VSDIVHVTFTKNHWSLLKVLPLLLFLLLTESFQIRNNSLLLFSLPLSTCQSIGDGSFLVQNCGTSNGSFCITVIKTTFLLPLLSGECDKGGGFGRIHGMAEQYPAGAKVARATPANQPAAITSFFVLSEATVDGCLL
jgi:hypothetical protein